MNLVKNIPNKEQEPPIKKMNKASSFEIINAETDWAGHFTHGS